MLDLRRFDRRSKPTKLETPCFWYQFHVSGVRNLDTSFWYQFIVCLVYATCTPVSGTSFWYQKLGRRTWVVCHQPNYRANCAAMFIHPTSTFRHISAHRGAVPQIFSCARKWKRLANTHLTATGIRQRSLTMKVQKLP